MPSPVPAEEPKGSSSSTQRAEDSFLTAMDYLGSDPEDIADMPLASRLDAAQDVSKARLRVRTALTSIAWRPAASWCPSSTRGVNSSIVNCHNGRRRWRRSGTVCAVCGGWGRERCSAERQRFSVVALCSGG